MTHTTYAPAPQVPTPAPIRRHHPRRTLGGWLLVGAGIVATGVLVLSTTSNPPQPLPTPAPNGSLTGIPRAPEIAEGWLAHHADVLGVQPGRYAGWPQGVPRSADAAERWFAQRQESGAPLKGWPRGVAHTPDALDRWITLNR